MNGADRIYMTDTRLLEDADVFRRRYADMPAERKKKIDACLLDRDRRLSLGAGILLRRALADAGARDAVILHGEDGKPFVPGGIHFNLSHSGDLAACAVSRAPVGLNLEALRHFGKDLAGFVFHESEIALARTRAEDPDAAFTALWTVKESVMKHSGSGLRLTPKRIRILSLDPVRVEADGTLREELRFTEFALPGYRMTVCSETGPFPDPEWIDPSEDE